MRPRILLPLAAAAALACAATASADSLVYVKDGNVWLSSPDASKSYQVTFDGGYSSPSQSDNGTIAALRGGQMVRMDRSGRPLNAPIDGMGSPATNNGNFYGPYEPRISPDGSKIAYWFGQYTSYYDYGCVCTVWRVESQSTWSRSDQFTDPTTESDYYKGIEQPEWLTNDHLIAQYPMFWMNIWTYEIGQGHGYVNGAAQYATSWRDSEGTYFDTGDPDLSPDGTHIAVTDLGDTNSNTRLLIGHVDGGIWTGSFPYPEPDYLNDTPAADSSLDCSWTADGEGALWNPTWSPDSSRLAISAPDGVHIFSNPATTDCASLHETLAIPGGCDAEWGKADVNIADRPSPPKTDNGNQGTGPGSPVQPSGPAAAGLSKLKLKPRAFRASKHGGSTISYTLAAPARITITVKRGAKSVKGSIKTAGKPGANKQRFAGRIAKRALRPGRYTLVVTASPVDGGAGQTSTAPFKIVR
jgi:hypothetical protein